MAPTTQYLPFATASGALVLAPTTYAADSQLASGAQPGIARVDLNNTTLRQCSMVAAALTQFVANELNTAINDDGNLATLITNLTNAIAAAANNAVLSSPAFTGNPTAPTPNPGDNDTSIATTAFVQAADTALTAAIEAWVTAKGYTMAGSASVSQPARSVGTIYQNTTGNNLMVSVCCSSHASSYSLLAGATSGLGLTLAAIYTSDAGSSAILQMFALIPNGWYYEITGGSVANWTEISF